MPWIIRRNKKKQKWEVVKKGTNEIVGTHESQEKAQAQVRALYAHEEGKPHDMSKMKG